MADITISDLELAPALADDMVLAVENTTDTYAATLAMLRRLINKTFVEVENADFNALTDDGFYQCTGTPTNSPVAGAINWTLQVSAENGVVVQRAFSLDDNFANLYIRRWNGVTWTGWLEVGAGALANKANISLSNLDATGQAKFDGKANTDSSNFTATGKENIVGWGIPDYKAGVDISSYTSSSNQFVCPSSGIVVFNVGGANNSPGHGYINNVEVMRESVSVAHWTSIPFQVYRGDTVYGSVQANYGTSKFYPYRGVK